MKVKDRREANFTPPEFKKTEILTKFDFPLLLLATEVSGKKWLLSWADSTEKPDDQDELKTYGNSIDSWFAFPVSKKRINQLLNEDISLREAILFHETTLFLVTSLRPLYDVTDLIEWRELSLDTISEDMLPLMDISIKGKSLMPQSKPNIIRIESHLLSTKESEMGMPLDLIGPYMYYIQKILKEAKNHILQDYPESARKLSRIGKLDLYSVLPGSIKIVADTQDYDKDRNLTPLNAIKLLNNLIEQVKNDKDLTELGLEVGEETLWNTYELMKFLKRRHVNLNLKLVSNYGTELSITIPYREISLIVNKLKPQLSTGASNNKIIIKLSDDAIEKVRKGQKEGGGYQSLFDALDARIDTTRKTMELNYNLIERIIRYYGDYGAGGWQSKLKPLIYPIVVELRKLGINISDFQ